MLSAAGEVPQHPTWLDSTQIYSTRFPSFSITTKYHLNVGGVIIERLPESMFTLFVYNTNTAQQSDGIPAARSMAFCQTQGKRRAPEKSEVGKTKHSRPRCWFACCHFPQFQKSQALFL